MLTVTSMLALSVALSLAFLLLIWGILRTRIRRPAALGYLLLWLGVLILVQLPFENFESLFVSVAAYQLFLTFPLVLFGLIHCDRPWLGMGMAIGAMLFVYVFNFFGPVLEWNRVRSLKDKYPLVSIADRLKYEKEAIASRRQVTTTAAVALPTVIEERLALTELPKRRRGIREHQLRQIHNEYRAQFELQRGFGAMRMGWVHDDRIQLPDIPPVPQPPPVRSSSEPGGSAADALYPKLAKVPPPDQTQLLNLHSNGLEDFLNFDRIGFGYDVDHVVGFTSHRFTSIPRFVLEPREDDYYRRELVAKQTDSPWRIARLDLIGLLKHPEPTAYVSDNLPQMDQLKNVPTRPLTQFEQDSLTKLRDKEDVVVENGTYLIRMLGAVRAGKDCLQCHSVQRGELLGAFSYEIVPQEPLADGKKE